MSTPARKRLMRDFRRLTDSESDWGSKLLFLPAMKNMTMLVVEAGPSLMLKRERYGHPLPSILPSCQGFRYYRMAEQDAEHGSVIAISFAGAPRRDISTSIIGQIMDQCAELNAATKEEVYQLRGDLKHIGFDIESVQRVVQGLAFKIGRMEGKAYRLQFPWVGVVNRSRADINKSVDMFVAKRREREYFSNNPDYKHLAHRMGSEYLAKVLSKHLETVIKSCIHRPGQI